MDLTFGTAQLHTSERMKQYPKLGKLFNSIFGYTNVGNYARFTVFKKLMNQVPLEDNAKILDLGTGYGEYSICLSNALPDAEIHALDIDKKRVKAVQKAVNSCELENIHVHHSYIENLREDNFDFIFSVDVFEHISPDHMPFKAAFDRLKKGGRLMVKIPNVAQKTILPQRLFEEHQAWLEDEHIGQVYDLAGLVKRFVKEGFLFEHCSYSDGWLSRFGWELAYLGKKAGFVSQLITLPLSKGLIKLDRLVHRGHWGNAIQVIGRKP